MRTSWSQVNAVNRFSLSFKTSMYICCNARGAPAPYVDVPAFFQELEHLRHVPILDRGVDVNDKRLGRGSHLSHVFVTISLLFPILYVSRRQSGAQSHGSPVIGAETEPNSTSCLLKLML